MIDAIVRALLKAQQADAGKAKKGLVFVLCKLVSVSAALLRALHDLPAAPRRVSACFDCCCCAGGGNAKALKPMVEKAQKAVAPDVRVSLLSMLC
jgi:hypothetical protein